MTTRQSVHGNDRRRLNRSLVAIIASTALLTGAGSAAMAMGHPWDPGPYKLCDQLTKEHFKRCISPTHSKPHSGPHSKPQSGPHNS